jgi:hypothetical protein
MHGFLHRGREHELRDELNELQGEHELRDELNELHELI